MTFSIAVLQSFPSLPPLDDLSVIIKNVAVVVGLAVGLATYISNGRQEKFKNSFSLIESFTRHISDDDLSILRDVHLSSYEGCRGSKPNHFVTYDGTETIPNRISNLFIQEGRGLVVRGRLASAEQSSEPNYERTCLGSVRLIAEQLNLIAFEVFRGQIEIRIVYYELSEVIEIICRFLDIAMKMEPQDSNYLKQKFKYLLKMRKKFPPSRFPTRTFSSLS